MKKSVQLAIRASEIKTEINDLDPGEETLARRRELLGQLNTVEAEYRSALAAEAEAEAAAPDAAGLTAEEREFRQLDNRAELRLAFRAVMNGSVLTGAELELQSHRGLSGHDIPWDMIAPRPRAPRTEDRADAVSPAPANSHLQQHPILERIFARSATATLGVAMPMVATGQQNFPTVTTTDEAVILAKDASEGDTVDAAITAHVITPARLQRSYIYRREDQAVLAGMEEALRVDLSGAVSSRRAGLRAGPQELGHPGNGRGRQRLTRRLDGRAAPIGTARIPRLARLRSAGPQLAPSCVREWAARRQSIRLDPMTLSRSQANQMVGAGRREPARARTRALERGTVCRLGPSGAPCRSNAADLSSRTRRRLRA